MPKSLSERIKWVLYHKNISRTQLALDAKVSTSSVNYWINGRVNNLAIDKCAEISKAYNLPVEWLAGDIEEDPVEFLDKPSLGKPVFLTTEDPIQAMSDFKTLKERFQWLVYHRQAITPEISRIAKVSQPTVLGWLSGKVRKIRPESQIALEEHYKLPERFFAINEGDDRDNDEAGIEVNTTKPGSQNAQTVIDAKSLLFLPLSCPVVKTDGSLVFELNNKPNAANCIVLNQTQTYKLRQDGADIEGLRCIAASDGAMFPRIGYKDLVLVDTNDRDVMNGQIYLISVQNQPPVIRKLILDERKDIVIAAENGDTCRTLVKKADAAFELKILGKVVFRAG